MKRLALPSTATAAQLGILVDTKASVAPSEATLQRPSRDDDREAPSPAQTVANLDEALALLHRHDVPTRSVVEALVELIDRSPALEEDLLARLDAHVPVTPNAADVIAWHAACAVDAIVNERSGRARWHAECWDTRARTPFGAMAALLSSGIRAPLDLDAFLTGLDLGAPLRTTRRPRWAPTMTDVLYRHGYAIDLLMYETGHHHWMNSCCRALDELKDAYVDCVQPTARGRLLLTVELDGKRWSLPNPTKKDRVAACVALLNRVLIETGSERAFVPVVSWFPWSPFSRASVARLVVGSRKGLAKLMRDGWIVPTYDALNPNDE
jgi:hypothetical protein